MTRLPKCVAVAAAFAAAFALVVGSFGVRPALAASVDSLTQVTPTPTSYAEAFYDPVTETWVGDFSELLHSAAGDVTAPVWAVGLDVPSSGHSNSGCEAADFAGFPAGSVALVQRGDCTFALKAAHAADAGAVAVLIFNEGDGPERLGVFGGTLSTPAAVPVVGTSFAVGDDIRNGALHGPTGVVVRIVTDGQTPPATPEQELEDFSAGVDNMAIPSDIKNALTSKLGAARAAVQRGNTGAACNQLVAFEHHVAAQSGKKLTTEQADRLLEISAGLRADLGC